MRGHAFRWFFVAAGSLLLGLPLSGQAPMERISVDDASPETHLGYLQDWTSQHLLMPGVQAEDILTAAKPDPRGIYSMMQRQAAVDRLRRREPGEPETKHPMKIDWAVSLEKGYVPQNQFPAKYQFSVTKDSCNSDYIVFGLTVTSGTQANLVGINNLYTSGTLDCNSGAPWVAFAYNTVTQAGGGGGQIKTSPELSADGTKVAFVESTNSGSYFHVLVLPNPIPAPPTQDGTVLSPQTPTSCTTPTIPGCMTTLTIQTSATDSISSPWVDYNTDTAYVGADNGLLYKITPVFGGGAPALVTSGGWPVTVSTQPTKVLTAPVVDDRAGMIYIGDGEGYLYSVSLSSPGGTYAAQVEVGWATHGAGTGIVDPPIAVADVANPGTDQIFAFTGCSVVLGIGGAVSQLPANFTSSYALSDSNTVDLGSASGNGDCTGKNVHSGTFDNAFWVNGSASGHMIACGFVQSGGTPAPPEMYMFPFTSGELVYGTGPSSTFQINTTKGDECSPLTEFYNGTTDRLFFGVGSSDGFLESSTISASTLATPVCTGAPTSTCVTTPSALGGTSGIVIDNALSNGGTNLYFSTLAVGDVSGQKCPSGVTGGSANPYCAVKLTQSALQ